MTEYVVVYDQDPIFVRFASEQLGVPFELTDYRTVSHVRKNDDGTLTMLAVVVLNNWTEHSVEMSIASEPGLWATKKFIRAVYDYAFYHAKKERIHMAVEPSNVAALIMHERLGHKYEGRLEDWFGADKDALIFGLTKRNYLKGKWTAKKGK